MLRFENDRISIAQVKSVDFQHPIPLLCVKPKNETDETVVFIYNSGIGASLQSCLYLNNSVYDNHYFVTYEKAGHNDNHNKASQFKKPYLYELDAVVEWVRKELPGKKIYLLGESWGTAINFVYYKICKEKIAGAICWNMPFTIVNPEKKTAKQMYSIVWRELLTFFFNVECHLPNVQESQDKFSRDRTFVRLLSIHSPAKSNTKINISVWRYMKPSFKFICKYGKNPNYNFMYIQSGQDVMANWKKIAKLEKNVDSMHYKKFPTGYHVLSLEPEESVLLYQEILQFIKR